MEFKPGDRVRIKPETEFAYQAKRTAGTVVPFRTDNEWISVRWDHMPLIDDYNNYPVDHLFLDDPSLLVDIEGGFSAEEIEQAQAIMDTL